MDESINPNEMLTMELAPSQGRPRRGSADARASNKPARGQRPAGSPAAGATATSPIDLMYEQFVALFGNNNPAQVFSLVWPGTVLDPDSYSYPDPSGPVPILTSAAQSKLFDQHYPIATITQPDGTRVSDRYRSAIERLGPIPNASLAKLQALLRDRLSQTTQMWIDGKIETMTIMDQFNYLNGQYNSVRQAWTELQTRKLAELQASKDPDWWEDYVAWYVLVAQTHIDAVNAAYDRLVAEFPLNEFQDAIAILSTQEAAALLRARNDLTQETMPLPPQIGGDFVVSQAIPADWGASLTPSTTFLDLLAGPDAQQLSLNNTIRYLQQQMFGWNAVIAQIPAGSQAEIQKSLDAFNAASNNYNATITNLLTTYTNNAVTAVQVYADAKGGSTDPDPDKVNASYQKLEQQHPASPAGPAKLSPEQIKDIATKIGAAQNALIGANASMTSAGVELARKATALLQTEAGAGLREMLGPIVDQLSSQLTLVQQQAAAVQSACVRAAMLSGAGAPTVPADPYHPNAPSDPPQGMPNPATSPTNQNWMYVTIDFDSKSLQTASATSTYFSQMNWSVDLFFGSAGGQSTTSSSHFASTYLSQGGKVRIGMLATKVLIDRPWMHPELFNLSSSYFRVTEDRLTTPDPTASGFPDWSRDLLVSSGLNGGANTTQAMATSATLDINKGPFPGYPVALLLAKDVTIHIEVDTDQTDALADASQQNSSEGGGLLCFSVSKTQSSSSNTKSAGSYATAGTYVFRIAAPQIVGAWLQIAPDDQSEVLSPELANQIQQALGFVSRLQSVSNAPRPKVQAPTRPVAA